MHADVAGSTALVQKDESLAHQRIRAGLQQLSKTVGEYGGIAREIRGDALVAEFSRASDAVCASLAFQAENTRRNATLDGEIRPAVHIGVSLGEVVIADGTLTGAGVVLAQRLEQLAPPGGVVVQGSVSETVPTRLPFEFESLGEQLLKGFDQPVRAFATRLIPGASIPESDSSAPDVELAALALPDTPSIAVLPFTNMSGDPEQEYFSDGLTEDIITALSHISGLLVIARHSTMVYKGQAVDVRQVGQEQGVRHVLEGSVRRAGNRIRVTAQLIQTETGHHQWAERYDRDLDDIFAVQDEIARTVTVEMQVQLTSGEEARRWASGTESFEAWSLHCQAQGLMKDNSKDGYLSALPLVRKALSIDPGYATAWTALGWTHWADAFFRWSDSRDASLKLAMESAGKALELQADSAAAFALIGQVHHICAEHDQAVEASQKAAALAPNDATIAAELAFCLTGAGRTPEAVRLLERALRLSPRAPAFYYTGLGYAYNDMGQHDLAIAALRHSIEIEPSAANTWVFLVRSLVESGSDDEEVVSAAQEVLKLDPKISIGRFWDRFNDPETSERLAKCLRRAGLPD